MLNTNESLQVVTDNSEITWVLLPCLSNHWLSLFLLTCLNMRLCSEVAARDSNCSKLRQNGAGLFPHVLLKQRWVATSMCIGGWLYDWEFSGLTVTWKTIFMNKEVIQICSLETYMTKTQLYHGNHLELIPTKDFFSGRYILSLT